jgi:hypothetical protein
VSRSLGQNQSATSKYTQERIINITTNTIPPSNTNNQINNNNSPVINQSSPPVSPRGIVVSPRTINRGSAARVPNSNRGVDQSR